MTIREWARSQGLAVGQRGLLPRPIIEAYKSAHGIGQRTKARVYRDPDSLLWVAEIPGYRRERFLNQPDAFTFALQVAG
jgi:hypothetical protein